MSSPIDILIVGFGAVGTVYGWVLSQNSNVRVTAIARSSYDEMSNGIRIESEKYGEISGWKPYRLVRNAEEANDRAYKYIICSTKALPDLLPTASVLAPFLESRHAQDTVDLEDGPCVVLIQNGIGIEHPLASAYPSIPIISVVAWIGANLQPGGRVTHGMLEKLIMGLYTGEGSEPVEGEQVEDAFGDPHGYRKGPDGPERLEEGKRRLKVFADLINTGGGTAVVVDDIQPKRYEKNLWNAALSSLCTLSRCTVSQAVDPAVLPYTLPVVRRSMLEVMYVARAWGYQEDVLPLRCVDEAIKITINNYQRPSQHSDPNTPFSPQRSDPSYGFPTEGDLAKESFESSYNFKPSMLLDAEAGRPMELEPIIGSLLDRARAKGVPTPRLDMAYSALKIQQDLAIRAYSSSATYQEHIKNWLSRPPAVAGLGAAGRKAWERAIKKAELPEHEQGSVEMAGWRDKIPGKPVRADSKEI
ncbi:protein of ketopantoate reductase family [Rhodotorula toruloides]|uniref:BY PROTMAP: gi/472582914/gb/EMS20576.1/ protein of ketopantoate reductase family [Rhodosporidium toruloides NP11] gi/647396756/emb/CDR39256.1/ RHTO0S04e03290g1_1 [Rhodosporidium toruloides] n=1 Tax=Rhodotorula toruloides TaxID=5286 RepID=A0A0K3CKP1_RHOTO|nr:protein of ketopantoate reductase family [Rhodotorula toruloides]